MLLDSCGSAEYFDHTGGIAFDSARQFGSRVVALHRFVTLGIVNRRPNSHLNELCGHFPVEIRAIERDARRTTEVTGLAE
jgi:hypothetical protein